MGVTHSGVTKFCENISNCFLNEIHCKTFSKLFCHEFIEKNFEKFFLQWISLKKIPHFFGKFEKKTIFDTKKKGELNNFSRKIRHDLLFKEIRVYWLSKSHQNNFFQLQKLKKFKLKKTHTRKENFFTRTQLKNNIFVFGQNMYIFSDFDRDGRILVWIPKNKFPESDTGLGYIFFYDGYQFCWKKIFFFNFRFAYQYPPNPWILGQKKDSKIQNSKCINFGTMAEWGTVKFGIRV